MEEWKKYRLGEICSRICSGGTPSSRHDEYYGGNIPWLNTKEIDFKPIFNTEKKITKEGLENSSAKWVEKDSIIVAMYGATAGKTAITKIPLTTNQACCNLTINSTVADYRFVYYSLANKFNELSLLANGGAQQNLNAQIIKNFVISLPEISTQKFIANILSSLDEKIENNRKINSNLEEQAKALFKSWFIDFEPFKGGKFVDSELGKIPEGWEVSYLEHLGKFKRGKTIIAKNAKEGLIPVVAGGMEPAYYHNEANTKGPVITVSASGANAGYMRLYYQDVWASDCSFLDSSNENLLWIYSFLNNNRRVLRHAQTGAVQPHVKPADINSITVCIPPHDLISKFQNTVSPLFKSIGLHQQETEILQKTRDTLLPKLMSGEIDVEHSKLLFILRLRSIL